MPEFMAIEQFDIVRNNIVFKMINGKDTDFLMNVPHVKYLDLAIIFYYILPGDENKDEKRAALIINECLTAWNVTVEDLMNAASVNTPKLLGLKIGGIYSTIAECLGESDFMDVAEMEEESIPLYVATNDSRYNGAAVILYKDMLRAFAAKMKSDLYVIPCSVHEVILVKVISGCQIDTDDLKDMISYVNKSSVPEADVLSDSLYYYSRATNTLCIA